MKKITQGKLDARADEFVNSMVIGAKVLGFSEVVFTEAEFRVRLRSSFMESMLRHYVLVDELDGAVVEMLESLREISSFLRGKPDDYIPPKTFRRLQDATSHGNIYVLERQEDN